MVSEAKLERTDAGLRPADEGWFVLNARDAVWYENADFGSFTIFEGKDGARFQQLGINIGVLEPGKPACKYHREEEQEDFLVVAGEAVLLIEGEERPLKAWDFVHCPPGTDHVLVGAGSGPCVVLAVGSRTDGAIVYPVSELAQRYGAGVDTEVYKGADAYKDSAKSVETPFRDGFLP